jgi:hypothetical protein
MKMKVRQIILIILLLSTSAGIASAEDVQLELYMADPEVRSAQKIYCQIDGAASTDILQAMLDGGLIYEKSGNLQAEEVFLVDYRNQQAGNHQLVVKIFNQSGLELASVSKNWTTLHDGIPTVGIDENNAIRVNGELFFPIYGVLNEDDFHYWIDEGLMNAGAKMNYRTEYTIQTYREWLDVVASRDTINIGPATRWAGLGENTHGRGNDLEIMRDYVVALKDHPGVGMWQWADEPDGGGDQNQAFPDEVRSWTDVLHQFDTNHPHAVNLTAYGWARDANWHHEHVKDYSYLYGADWHNGEKKLVGDVIGFDFYPIEYATKDPEFFGGLEVNFESMAKALDRIREYNYNLAPIFSWIEHCDLHPDNDGDGYADGPGSTYLWTPAPTPEEVWAEYWIKVIHGVKGFKPHSAFASDCHSQPPRNHETLAKFMTWIEDLKGVVLGPEYSGSPIVDEELNGGRIDIMVREGDGNLYLFTGNLRRQQESVKFTVPGLESETVVQVYGEGRSITANNGYFEDTFDPLGVHIYVLPYAQDQPTFEDVPFDHWAHFYIEALYQGGYVAGCNSNPLLYCPERIMNRAESSVFIVRGAHGAEFIPPDPTEKIFDDVAITDWYANWTNQLWLDGYTAGCGTDPLIYCPLQEHTIAEGCVFYLRMRKGADYEPPDPAGIFADAPQGAWYTRWIEDAYNEGILMPCQTEPELMACPLDPLDRAMGAYMMFQAKGMQIP